ncbi:hypothetical protein [Neobacillus drentensis]|uniref:hypothetical protein n=1 Tax=Neobacillus drentensis TaxID=220684 RepID=UPI00159705DC
MLQQPSSRLDACYNQGKTDVFSSFRKPAPAGDQLVQVLLLVYVNNNPDLISYP